MDWCHTLFGKHIKRHWVQINLVFEPEDLWIGLYWRRYPEAIDLHFGFLPSLQIEFYIQRH